MSRSMARSREQSMEHGRGARSKEHGTWGMGHGADGPAAEVTSGHVEPSDLDSRSSRIV
jgi:hypothetical protein